MLGLGRVDAFQEHIGLDMDLEQIPSFSRIAKSPKAIIFSRSGC